MLLLLQYLDIFIVEILPQAAKVQNYSPRSHVTDMKTTIVYFASDANKKIYKFK